MATLYILETFHHICYALLSSHAYIRNILQSHFIHSRVQLYFFRGIVQRVKRLLILLACLVLCPLFAVKERRTSCSLLFSKSFSSAILTAYVGFRENIGTLSNWYLLIPTAPCYATKLNRDERTENCLLYTSPSPRD